MPPALAIRRRCDRCTQGVDVCTAQDLLLSPVEMPILFILLNILWKCRIKTLEIGMWGIWTVCGKYLLCLLDFSRLRWFACRSLLVLPLYLVGRFFFFLRVRPFTLDYCLHLPRPATSPQCSTSLCKRSHWITHLVLVLSLPLSSLCLCCGCSKPSFMDWFII